MKKSTEINESFITDKSEVSIDIDDILNDTSIMASLDNSDVGVLARQLLDQIKAKAYLQPRK